MLAGIIVNGQAREERGEILKLKVMQTTSPSAGELPFCDHPSATYVYKLEGSDHDWHYLNSSNIDITYNELSYGDYDLRFMPWMAKAEDSRRGLFARHLRVLPPWYLSWWCKLFYITALIVFVAWLSSSIFCAKSLMPRSRRLRCWSRYRSYGATQPSDGRFEGCRSHSFDEVT